MRRFLWIRSGVCKVSIGGCGDGSLIIEEPLCGGDVSPLVLLILHFSLPLPSSRLPHTDRDSSLPNCQEVSTEGKAKQWMDEHTVIVLTELHLTSE
jgi:hypothetical protein